VLVHEGDTGREVDATMTLPKMAFLGMIFGGQKAADLIQAGALKVDGNPLATAEFMAVLDPPAPPEPFPIVTP
jgi:alkyl sulfatase BDS1-like metallo-beta-lactamase superfamily hydrolase